MEETCSWFVNLKRWLFFLFSLLFKTENSTGTIIKDEKQSIPNLNSQQSQESNAGSVRSVERQASQPTSSSYTASQTNDDVRYEAKQKLTTSKLQSKKNILD